MNPALLNYLMSNQQNQDQMESVKNEAQRAIPNQQVNIQANPFDSGIRRAVETARESMEMTDKQQDKALRRGLLNFAANISQTPKQKGFFANFGTAAQAAIPAMLEYDTAEANYEADNNALANQILADQDKQREGLAKAEEQAWKRRLEEDKLAEMKRYHDLIDAYNQAKLNTAGKSDAEKTMELAKLLDNAEKFLRSPEGQKSQIGRLQSMSPLSIPDIPQASLKQYEDSIKGALFNKRGFKNAAEFGHTPSINSKYDPATNLRIIQDLRNNYINNNLNHQQADKSSTVLMQDNLGTKYNVPSAYVESALNDPTEPLTLVE